jgi:predicted PhzF superfamily epimerase YddE/YHI9
MAPTLTAAPEYLILLSAFTSKRDCGNPAAVVFLSSTCLPSPNAIYPTEKLQAIAKNLNQPITAFVSPLPDPTTAGPEGIADFAIRWFTIEREVPICGHGTLAAAKAIFAYSDFLGNVRENSAVCGESGGATRVNGGYEDGILKLMTGSGTVVSAQKQVVSFEGSNIELMEVTLPHCPLTPIPPTSSTSSKVRMALSIALQKPAEEIDVKFMGQGEGLMADYLLIELGEDEKLEGRTVMTDAFKETGYIVNILTTAASSPTSFKETFVSRMFAPLAGVPEDQVCGSAHCLLTPYWAQKRASPVDTTMQARQVSPRGGSLRVRWIPSTADTSGFVNIGGEVVAWGRGEVFI